MMNDESLRVIHHSLFSIQPSLLVIRLSALGDVIHTIPAVVALRDRYDISWIVESPYRELVELVANVKTIPVTLRKYRTLPRAIRSVRGFDVAIDFQGLIKSGVIARISGARERIGFHRDFIKEKPAAWFLNRHVRIDPSTHVVDWNLALAGVDEAPSINFTPFASGDFPEYRDAIVLLPGAGRPNKIWPAERFRDLAKRIGDRALAVWGPGEEELARKIGCRLA